MDNFADAIKTLRNKREWSQRQLALISGVSNTEINRLEKGERKKPSLKVIEKISKAFGITMFELMQLAKDSTDNPIPDQGEKDFPPLTDSEQQDIEYKIKLMMEDLTRDKVSVRGQILSEDEKKMLRLSLEHTLIFATQLAREKKNKKADEII